MNKWIKKSLDLAKKDYVDKIYEIYPSNINPLRDLSDEDEILIKKAYDKKDPIELVNSLINLEKFPIDDSYIGMLRLSDEIRKNNELSMKRIGDHLLQFDFDTIVSLCKQPKSSSRQMGPMFKIWLSNNFTFLTEEDFVKSKKGVFFLSGNDNFLKDFVNKKFDANLRKPYFKGIDFVFKKDEKYCMGEAKFISSAGGGQTNQFDITLRIANLNIKNLSSIAIVDGIPWFLDNFNKHIIKFDRNVFSGLLLKEFIKEF